MKFNKKGLISSVILIGAIVISSITSYNVKSNADEETLTQVKQQLQEKDKELENKINESSDKDKKIEELNSKVSEQENTINQLNNSVQSLSTDLDDTKQVQKQDKKEVIIHSDSGDAKLQQQIDSQKAQKEAEDKKRAEAKKNNDKNAPDNPKNNVIGNGAPYQKIEE